MRALPSTLRSTEGLQVTGLSCPDCDGVLQVAVADPDSGFLHFVCRIGHALSLREVMAAKEAAIESAMRGCELALAEMIQLLDDIEREDIPAPASAEARGERRARLERHLDLVRAVVEQDRPLDLGTVTADLGTVSARDASAPAAEPA